MEDDYSGHVKVEVLFEVRKGKRMGFLEGRSGLSIKLLLGKPQIVGCQTKYPVELPASGIYDPNRDGKMSEDAATGFMVRRALGEHTQVQLRFLGSEECGLMFNTRPTHRVTLVGKCYIDEGLERQLARNLRWRMRTANAIIAAIQRSARRGGNDTVGSRGASCHGSYFSH